MAASQQGLLLVGHGTRDPRGTDEFLQLANVIAGRLTEVVVRPCFLELVEPSIEAAVGQIVGQGVERVVVVPVLLFAAAHVKRDIPHAVQRALSGRPAPRFVQAAHLGRHKKVLELSEQRYRERVKKLEPILAKDSLLLMVGRGSRDPSAIAEMRSLAELRRERMAGEEVRTAFVAMAEPSVDDAFWQIRQLPVRRVIVQPHLLFCGQILQKLNRQVDISNRETAHQHWISTSHLGAAPAVADAVIDRFLQALTAQAI